MSLAFADPVSSCNPGQRRRTFCFSVVPGDRYEDHRLTFARFAAENTRLSTVPRIQSLVSYPRSLIGEGTQQDRATRPGSQSLQGVEWNVDAYSSAVIIGKSRTRWASSL